MISKNNKMQIIKIYILQRNKLLSFYSKQHSYKVKYLDGKTKKYIAKLTKLTDKINKSFKVL